MLARGLSVEGEQEGGAAGDVLRLFVGVAVDEGVRGRLAALQHRLRPLAPEARWVAPELFHITLKFLGDTPRRRLPDLQESLAETGRRHDPIEVELVGLGAFPDPRRARVLWVGVGDGSEELKRLSRAIDRELERLGLERDRKPFAGHLTLARIRRPRPLPRLARELEHSRRVRAGRWLCREFLLLASELRRGGPRHTPLGRFALGEQ